MSANAARERAGAAPTLAAPGWSVRQSSLRASSERTAWAATAGVLCFAVTAFLSRYLFWDSYLDLTGGRYVAHHGIPRHEVLTTAAHRTWIDQQWLAHWAYYEAWNVGGYPLVAALSSLFVASGFALLCALISRRGVPPQRAFIWTLVAFVVCFGSTVIRAQSFAFPLFVLVLWAILADDRRPSALFLFVIPLLVLWSNLHGTILLAIMLVVGYSFARVVRAARARTPRSAALYAAAAAAAVGTAFANPYGLSIVDYYRALIGNPVVSRYIIEWAPPSLGFFVSYGFFALLFGVIAVTAYGLGRGWHAQPALLGIVAFLALLATRGVRYQVWFALAASVLAAETLAAVRPSPPKLAQRMQRVGAVVIAGFALAAVVVLARTGDAIFERLVPRGAMSAAATFAGEHPRAKILADAQTSSALLWLHPETVGRVGFDARLEQYPPERLRRWFTYLGAAAPGYPALVRRYDVIVVARKGHSSLVAGLERLRGWRTIFADDDGLALARSS